MATVRDLIKGSLRLLGAIAPGETPSADEQAEALLALNSMISSWSTESLTIYSRVRESFTLTPGQQMRTLGVGGSFNTSRPMEIEEAKLLAGGVEMPVRILTSAEWAALSMKDTPSEIPYMLYVEWDYPLAKVYLYPVPSVANSLILYSRKPLTGFSSPNDTLELPEGYERALRYNLAVELAPEYGKEPTPKTEYIALESKANIKRANLKPVLMTSDVPGSCGRRFNILSGGYE